MEEAEVCSCVADIANSFVRLAKRSARESVIYQTSLMSALIDGVYEGDVTIADLLTHGDFGLGTFNGLDGELIAFDSEVHQLREDGSARAAKMSQKTPFAVMTHFQPTLRARLSTELSKKQIEKTIDDLVGSENLFAAFRIAGHFSRVETRTVPRQEKPYLPMLKAIERQPKFVFEDVSGTLVGFRCPEYLQGVNVAGFHVHFITDDRRGGGHVLDYTMLDAKIEVAKVANLRIDLPQTEDFANATLHSDELDIAIREAEG